MTTSKRGVFYQASPHTQTFFLSKAIWDRRYSPRFDIDITSCGDAILRDGFGVDLTEFRQIVNLVQPDSGWAEAAHRKIQEITILGQSHFYRDSQLLLSGRRIAECRFSLNVTAYARTANSAFGIASANNQSRVFDFASREIVDVKNLWSSTIRVDDSQPLIVL